MSDSFFKQPILNGPYTEPSRHHHLDAEGQPTDQPPCQGRRPSALWSPVPKPKKHRARQLRDDQQDLRLHASDGLSSEDQEYNPTPIINEIRAQLKQWRTLPNPQDWGVTPTTVRLLQHWRHHDFQGIRPFFCQVEAVETIIWLTEVALKSKRKPCMLIWQHIKGANADANPDLLRLALKMATGAGKTTVMAMLIAWQTLNAVRSPASELFTHRFLIIAPGITIKDRLRVLQPNDPDSYYQGRELVPADLRTDLNRARIVITNYHAFQRRETLEANKITRALLHGRAKSGSQTEETEGQMVDRVAKALGGIKNIIVINDEAHHCYHQKPDGPAEWLTGDARKEAKENSEAARVWIKGIEAFKRKLGVRSVYDLSATPFFLSGSGWAEGTLFPWTVSDFSLMDAIECGIVKLPRIPVDDNIPGADMPIFRNLWDHIGKDMPKKGGQTADPHSLPDKLKTALHSLYGHYEKVADDWERQGIDVPPVFIVVCNNTSTSKLVHEWISGWQRPNADGEPVTKHCGHLERFSNFDSYSRPLARPNSLLIDSRQIERGKLDKNFRDAAALEIEKFKKERKYRGEQGDITDAELLREVMNTVGKKGRLGEHIRCVVSVSMLTEGWDANTVTHILGIRAFGTQLLCEQVVGRALRRFNYDLDSHGLFASEYADILGIPFNFTAKPVVAPPHAPKRSRQVKALPERAALEITFPRVTGYRLALPEEGLQAEFTPESRLVIDHDLVGASQTDMSGIVGEGHTLSLKQVQASRPSEIAYRLAKEVLNRRFVDGGGAPKVHLFGYIKGICRRWLEGGYLDCPGDTAPWMVCSYPAITAQAVERIVAAIVPADGGDRQVTAVIDPYNPKGSTRHVNFTTTKDLRTTDPRSKCHVNYVVSDSEWEAEFARVAENHPQVLAYVKNQGLGFSVPYKDGGVARDYLPDFIVQVDDGRDDPLNLIVEIKGMKNEQVKVKKATVTEQWVPGVNALGAYGRWAFAQFESVFDIDKEFRSVVARAIADSRVS